MSIDTRARRAADGVRASAQGVNPMAQLGLLKREAKARRRAGVVFAVAVIAALVAAGGLLYGAKVLDSADLTQPVGPTQPENVARAFLQAYGDHDADRAISYLSDGKITGKWGSRAALRRQVDWDVASGYQEFINRCEQLGHSGSDHMVRCTFSYNGLRSAELGLGPYRDNFWDLTVRHGRIISADNQLHFLSNGFSEQMWTPFASWVSAEHPADVETMYIHPGLERQTPESIALWRQYTHEYVGTGVAYIGRARAICAAAHDRVSDKGRTSFYDRSWGRVLDDALMELRSVAPPQSVRARFDKAYGLVAQLAEGMRSGQMSIDVLHQVEASGIGLEECTFHGPR